MHELVSQLVSLFAHFDLGIMGDFSLWQKLKAFLDNPQKEIAEWIAQFGVMNVYGILATIIFCETGLVVMPWLPGDSLLFVAGSLCSAVDAKEAGGKLNIWVLCVLLPLAAIIGDNLNYWIGRYLGPKVFKKKKSWLFNADVLHRTQRFYEKHGTKMVMLARFVPLVRTFAPFVAGVGRMNYKRFLGYGILGAFVWVIVCCGAGYFFGNIPWVKARFEFIVIAVIIISILPAVFAWWKARAEAKEAAIAAAAAEGTSEES